METSSIILIAFLIDNLMGDPQYRFHPVRIMGKGIEMCLGIIKGIGLKGRGAGVLLTLVMVLTSVVPYGIIHLALLKIHTLVVFFFDLFVCYSCLALKDLFNHILPVIKALEANDFYAARRAIGMVVGRDVNSLDRAGVIRAAIETMAENFVDGFLSPVFWYAAGSIAGILTGVEPVFTGISFMLIFKTASTLDSMVGYKNEEFIDIGWAGARLDDVMNFIPARISLIILSIGAWLGRQRSVDGMRTAMRDRRKHDSPNSAHAESFVAGALNIRLGGPTRYPDGINEKPWLGAEYPDPDLSHIPMTIRLLNISSWITITAACIILICYAF